jgi:hypothetical protein
MRRLRQRKVFFALIAGLSLGAANLAQADEWVTPKNPKHGYRLLGRVILMVEIRADGTVKRAWPAAASTHSRAAWRAAHAAQELTFRPGSERTMRLPVTVYLD